jgi:hypothetical protein
VIGGNGQNVRVPWPIRHCSEGLANGDIRRKPTDERLPPARRSLTFMTVQPLLDPDPDDPAEILRALPEEYRAQFLREYADAVVAASDPAQYRALREFLRLWRLHAYAASQPGFAERMAWAREAVRTGDWGETIPLENVIAAQPPR